MKLTLFIKWHKPLSLLIRHPWTVTFSIKANIKKIHNNARFQNVPITILSLNKLLFSGPFKKESRNCVTVRDRTVQMHSLKKMKYHIWQLETVIYTYHFSRFPPAWQMIIESFRFVCVSFTLTVNYFAICPSHLYQCFIWKQHDITVILILTCSCGTRSVTVKPQLSHMLKCIPRCFI